MRVKTWLSWIVLLLWTLIIALLWARSYHYQDSVYTNTLWLESYRGSIRLSFIGKPASSREGARFISCEVRESWWNTLELDFAWRVLGAWYAVPRVYDSISVVCVPNWVWLTPSLVFAARYTIRGFVRRSRRCRNRCIVCAYDLTGSGDRCPECGAVQRQQVRT
jgi:hypothetical protein